MPGKTNLSQKKQIMDQNNTQELLQLKKRESKRLIKQRENNIKAADITEIKISASQPIEEYKDEENQQEQLSFIGLNSEFIHRIQQLQRQNFLSSKLVNPKAKKVIDKAKRPTQQSQLKSEIIHLLNTTLEELDKRNEGKEEDKKVMHRNMFQVAKINNDTQENAGINERKCEKYTEPSINLAKQAVIGQLNSHEVNVVGPKISIACNILTSDIIASYAGSILMDTDPHLLCAICDSTTIDMKDFSSLSSQIDHFRKAHKLFICLFCQQPFATAKDEQNHRYTQHSELIQLYQGQSPDPDKNIRQQTQVQIHLDNQKALRCGMHECEYQTTDQMAWLNHNITVHGDYDARQIKAISTFQGDEYASLGKKEADNLMNLGIIGNKGYFKDGFRHPQVSGNARLFLVQYKGRLQGALRYAIPPADMERICLVDKIWVAGAFKLELGILIQELDRFLCKQRVTEIFGYFDKAEALRLTPLKFFPSMNQSRVIQFDAMSGFGNNQTLLSRKTTVCLSSYISRIATPQIKYFSARAQILTDLMQGLKEKGIEEMLQRYLNFQMNSARGKANQVAQESDQAVTTELVFQKIYNKIKIKQEHFFDCCIFQQNWRADTHYNALQENWLGKFIFCNPPYSVTSCFITKAVIEFLKGKSIVMVIPQPRSSDGLGAKLLPYLGEIHKQGLIRFDPFLDVVQSPIQIVYLIQPDHLSFIEASNKCPPQKKDKSSYVSKKVLLKCPNWDQEIQEVALRLLAQRVPIQQVQSIVKVSKAIVNKWAKIDLEEFMKRNSRSFKAR